MDKMRKLRIILLLCVIAAAFACVAPLYAAEDPVHIKVEQVFSVPSQSEDVTYTYMLRPHDKSTPMPEGCETGEDYFFTITGHKSKHIGPIKFKKQGVYRYDLRMMVMRNRPGLVYDMRIYTIDVYVNSELDTGVVVLNENGRKAESVVFTGYSEGLFVPQEPGEPEKPADPQVPPAIGPGGQGSATGVSGKTGDETNISLYASILVVSGFMAVGLIYLSLRKRSKHEEGPPDNRR